MRRDLRVVCLFTLVLALPVWAQPPTTPKQEPATAQPKLSTAEQIARLERSIATDEQALQDLLARLDDPQGEFAKVKQEFNDLDAQLVTLRQDLAKLHEQEGTADKVTQTETEIANLEKRWKLAKDRFDLLLEQRKTQQEAKTTLEQRLQQSRDALNKLLSTPTSQPASSPADGTDTQPAPQPVAPVQPATNGTGTPTPAAAPTASTTPGVDPATGAAPPGTVVKPPSKELIQAQQAVQEKETAAQSADERAASLGDSITKLERLIELDREQLATARKQSRNAQQTERALTEQVRTRSSENAPREELTELWNKIAEARTRQQAAADEVTQLVERVDQREAELNELEKSLNAAEREAEAARQEADAAQRKLQNIQNPLSPKNIRKWFIERGPRVLGILLVSVLLIWVVRTSEGRIVKLFAASSGHGSRVEREDRAKTLAGVFRSAAAAVIVVSALLMIVSELGVEVAPLIGASAVLGLAVAFGAQNLVRDYFTGFLILLENQYAINDVVKIGDTSGLVERITLRVTVLRGLDGTVHFVPNGEIKTVSNMTHGWSRALFEIGVAYKEDVDQVMDVLTRLGREMRQDPNYSALILDDPEMLGVDGFGDSAVTIKFFIKTRPLQQWIVKRALLRRIKHEFDNLGIEIPFPHRTIFHHHENQPPVGVDPGQDPAWPPGT